MNVDVAMKRCSKCGQEKPATREHFAGLMSSSGSVRLRAWCRACCSAYTAGRKHPIGRPPADPLKRAACRYGCARRGSHEEAEARDALIVAVLEHVEKSRAA